MHRIEEMLHCSEALAVDATCSGVVLYPYIWQHFACDSILSFCLHVLAWSDYKSDNTVVKALSCHYNYS